MRRLVLAVGGLATVFFVGFGCYALVDWLAVEHRTATESFAATPTLHLAVEGGGTIRVVGDGGDRTRVEFRWREGLREPVVEAYRAGDRVVVHTRCRQNLDPFCRVSATVHVPRGTTVDGGGASALQVVDVGGPVTLASENGSIRVEGAAGPITATSENGTITVVESRGAAFLGSENGSVRTESLRATAVRATSENGRVELDLASAPRRVVARSENGSVTVLVPNDRRPWATTLSSENGSTDEPILISPEAGRSIEAKSENGSVSVRYRD